jgi:hypothetical protein
MSVIVQIVREELERHRNEKPIRPVKPEVMEHLRREREERAMLRELGAVT